MKGLVRWLVASLVGVVLVGLVVGLPSVAHAETMQIARTLHEAWYLRYKEPLAKIPGKDPSCDTPLGCNLAGNATRPVPLPYPDNTLHVASNAGEPDAQTYLSFDLSRAPQGAAVTGGTMTLVAAPADSGTLNEARADMVACLVTESFVSVKSGPWVNRPNFDLHTCSPLIRVPGTRPAKWRVHLGRFGAKWSADANHDGVADVPNYGITVLPNPRITRGAPLATWKVAFDGRRRRGGTPVTSTLNFKMLAKARHAEPLPAAPLLARPERSARMPGQPFSSPRALTPPDAFTHLGVSDVPSSPLQSQTPRPWLVRDAGQNASHSVPLVVATADTRGFLGYHQAVWFVALLGFGVAGLVGWSLTSQARLRGGFRWIAAMGLTRRMPVAPLSEG
jgi:hypothetical protein